MLIFIMGVGFFIGLFGKRNETRYSARFPSNFKFVNLTFLIFGGHFTVADDISMPSSLTMKEQVNAFFPDFKVA